MDDNTLLKDSGTDWSSLAKKIQDDLAKLRRQVKMLSQQVKLGAETGGKADGDQAILSSKPLLGLRCMSCDRCVPLVTVAFSQ